MKKKTTWIAIAVVVNVLLLALNLGVPERASAWSPRGMYDCCQESSRGGEYCCAQCCWLPWGCGEKETCGDA